MRNIRTRRTIVQTPIKSAPAEFIDQPICFVAVLRAGRLQTVLDAEGVTEDLLIAHATGTH